MQIYCREICPWKIRVGTEEKFKKQNDSLHLYDFEIFKKESSRYGKLKAQEEFLKEKI
jgi:hypothetical protein